MTEIEDGVEEKTEFKFSELSDDAKEKARDAYRYGRDYPYDEWWDAVYEDAVRMGGMLGITITTRKRKTTRGHEYQETGISFSGFSSQGDGASFKGNYRFKEDAIEQITKECNDGELLRIASELTLLQVTRRLQGHEPVQAAISASGSYCHSGTMNIELDAWDDDRSDDNEVYTEAEVTVTQLMKDFADWIYKRLEEENDYLMSDDVVDQALDDDLFDEDGCMI